MSDARVQIIPVSVAIARATVDRLHRHHISPPISLTYYCLGAVADGILVGVAIVGRPSNRNSDDGQTGEVLRVATDGTPNACSALYGACARVARRMGFARLITYTLSNESGSSLRGAGWRRDEDGIESWWHRYPERNAEQRRTVQKRDHYRVLKTRWSVTFREPLSYTLPSSVLPDGQLDFDLELDGAQP